MKALSIAASVVLATLPARASPSVNFADLATPFEQVADATMAQPMDMRVKRVRTTVNALLPGIYAEDRSTDRSIAAALTSFPAARAGYEDAVRKFPDALRTAVVRFRRLFPRFIAPLPIYLYHSLGERDGGSVYLEPGQRHVMLFGADLIARYHSDDSLQPFLDHELFHLEHARSFPDCDQFWCSLWQEGLAVYAAAAMTPDATDRQLLLDIPGPIRRRTDEQWATALCFVATHFDDTRETVVGQALAMGGQPPNGLPDRFGYYVGLRLAQTAGRSLSDMTRMNHQAARRLVRATILRMTRAAHARCALPATASDDQLSALVAQREAIWLRTP